VTKEREVLQDPQADPQHKDPKVMRVSQESQVHLDPEDCPEIQDHEDLMV